jgi:hypothetical protein
MLLNQYSQVLKLMIKDCNFKDVTAEWNKNKWIRYAFISGLIGPHIQQRLLENTELNIDAAFDQTRPLETAK